MSFIKGLSSGTYLINIKNILADLGWVTFHIYMLLVKRDLMTCCLLMLQWCSFNFMVMEGDGESGELNRAGYGLPNK